MSGAGDTASMAMAALPVFRQNQILTILKERGQATVIELVEHFRVSRDTIRRDLDLLEQRGLLIRTHGGAVHNDQLVRVDSTLIRRMDEHVDAKRRIGEAAAQLITDGETLILNGGSTTCAVAAALGERRNLTVITNNLRLPPATPEAAVRSIHILGGTYWDVSQVTIGTVGFASVAGISADTAVVGVTAISAAGLSMGRLEEATETSSMIDIARRTIVVADHSKFNRTAFARVGAFDRIDILVTDAPPPDAMRQVLDAAGVALVVCGG
ncbi:DeoR/GlpR family DNA-binding transcription regulator [Acidisoma cladoniae]|jgi:DeoR family fructose operon transcriptional repressor|uniref:DeoR/GlpR family DNA-binding transcription regulator n=1 Tax=Acidisoma cladoniae TaxID=3040935 RepID=UPI00254E42EE|nr:DeoR/GlpR family DNA-binding transcription regulator [Acidisoma sp. PAMC 29798]